MRFAIGTKLRCIKGDGSASQLHDGSTYYCIGGPTEYETHKYASRVYVAHQPGGDQVGNPSGWDIARFVAAPIAGPATSGVYEVRTSKNEKFFSYWDGKKWGWVDSSAEGASRNRGNDTSYWADAFAVTWRSADQMDLPVKKSPRSKKLGKIRRQRLLLL